MHCGGAVQLGDRTLKSNLVGALCPFGHRCCAIDSVNWDNESIMSEETDTFWQDREIKFDIPPAYVLFSRLACYILIKHVGYWNLEGASFGSIPLTSLKIQKEITGKRECLQLPILG